MRLTKRQLKRIIREEYTRLKRKGLIREMGPGRSKYEQVKGEYGPNGGSQDRINEMIMFLDDLMSSERGMAVSYTHLTLPTICSV